MTVPIPPGPPFDLDVLADLHAGVYPDEIAAVLRARVATDPRASATLAALDATVADLHDLNDLPPIPIPRQVAARLDAAIAAEARARVAVGAPLAPMTPSPPIAPTQPAGPGPLPPTESGRPDQPAPGRPAGPAGPAVPPPRSHTTPDAQPAGPASPADRTGPAARPAVPPVPPQASPVVSLDRARLTRARRTADRRRRQTRWATGLGIAAAVAAVFTIGAVIWNPDGTPGTGMAGEQVATTTAPTSPTAPSGASRTTASPGPGTADGEPAPGGAAPDSVGNGAGAQPPPTGAPEPTRRAVVAEPHHLDRLLPQIEDSDPEGPLSDPIRLGACLAANHANTHQVLGVLPVTYQGRPGYALSVRTSQNTVRILVVGPDCGKSGAELMAEQDAPG